MAIIQGSFSPCIIIHQSAPLNKSVFGVALRRKSQFAVMKAAKLQIRSSVRDQVFEDHSTGIICYKDDRGEIICEGFDEGPRLLQPHPPTPCQLSDAEILDRLQKRWLQIVDGQTANDCAFVEKHTYNGFNALH